MNWDEFYINQAILTSLKSKDPSTKVGCVIVDDDNVLLSIGFNGFPRGVVETFDSWNLRHIQGQLIAESLGAPTIDSPPTFDRWERPQKYSYVEHAERNAVFNAARKGVSLKGARAYLNWEPTPCEACSRALIQAGIKEVIGPSVPFSGVGKGVNYSLDFAKIMFEEAEVKQTIIQWSNIKTDKNGRQEALIHIPGRFISY